MKKYRRLEARRRADELHNQFQIADFNQQILALNRQLETMEKQFSSFDHHVKNQDSFENVIALS
jgi:hypothetical protein